MRGSSVVESIVWYLVLVSFFFRVQLVRSDTHILVKVSQCADDVENITFTTLPSVKHWLIPPNFVFEALHRSVSESTRDNVFTHTFTQCNINEYSLLFLRDVIMQHSADQQYLSDLGTIPVP